MPDAKAEDTVIRVAWISGSRRAGSYTRLAVAAALRGAGDGGAETQLIDGANRERPVAPDLPRLPRHVGRTGRRRPAGRAARLPVDVRVASLIGCGL